MPRFADGANAIVFTLDRDDPLRSRVSVVPHPYPDPEEAPERVYPAAVAIPSRGALILGGEQPGDSHESPCLASGEVFLEDEDRLAQLAVRLTTARSRHQAYYVEVEDVRSVFLIGGTTNTAEKGSLAAVEEIPVR